MNRPSSGLGATTLYWVCYGVTVTSAAVSLGYSLAAARTGGLAVSIALYATSRSAALAALVVSVPRWRSGRVLLAAAGAMTVVQALDAVVGLTVDDPVKVAGPAGTAAATAVTAILYARSR